MLLPDPTEIQIETGNPANMTPPVGK